MSKYYHPAGIDDQFHYCDMCEIDDGRPTFNFKDKDFDICEECTIKLLEKWGYDNLINLEIKIERMVISERLRNKIFARDGKKCIQCQSTDNLTIDHIKPFSKGGETTEDNLQTLCKKCNLQKGAKWLK